MIKKTLYFGNPAYLSLRNKQLVIRLPEIEKSKGLPDIIKKESVRTIPIEDIGMVVLDNREITITEGVIAALLDNTAAVITCNEKRMPTGLLLPLEGNTLQNERFRSQIEASVPLKKQLWQQTIKAKIENQAWLLSKNSPKSVACLFAMARDIKSGDSDNFEAQAAVYYWKYIFQNIPNAIPDFKRSGRHLSEQFAQLRICDLACNCSTGTCHEWPAAGSRHPPPQQIQRLLPC